MKHQVTNYYQITYLNERYSGGKVIDIMEQRNNEEDAGTNDNEDDENYLSREDQH